MSILPDYSIRCMIFICKPSLFFAAYILQNMIIGFAIKSNVLHAWLFECFFHGDIISRLFEQCKVYLASFMTAQLSSQSNDFLASRACFSISSRRSTKSPAKGHFESRICSRIKFNWDSRLDKWFCAVFSMLRTYHKIIFAARCFFWLFLAVGKITMALSAGLEPALILYGTTA